MLLGQQRYEDTSFLCVVSQGLRNKFHRSARRITSGGHLGSFHLQNFLICVCVSFSRSALYVFENTQNTRELCVVLRNTITKGRVKTFSDCMHCGLNEWSSVPWVCKAHWTWRNQNNFFTSEDVCVIDAVQFKVRRNWNDNCVHKTWKRCTTRVN